MLEKIKIILRQNTVDNPKKLYRPHQSKRWLPALSRRFWSG
jgi:hypothetical protein